MFIKSIRVENFRNIKHAELEFSSGVNIFCGDNAQGKTNLLEAIAICLGKSFRNIRRTDILPFNMIESNCRIAVNYEIEAISGKVNEIVYEADVNSYSVKINDIPLKKATDLYGEFKYVVFTPDNLGLVKGEPALRRGYLDNIAIMQNKAHRKFANEYNSALKQRCMAYWQKCSPQMLEIWDDILIKQGINLTYGRLKYLELIREYACEIYQELSGGEKNGENGEKLDISYESNVFGFETDFADKTKLYDIYAQKLQSVDSEGQSSKTHGAHKDDILFSISGKNARTFASQGQLRSIVVALKLAEAQIIRSFNRENPVVLLDEVLGELDENRRGFVLKHFDNSQCFITSCNVQDFEGLTDSRIWSVNDGVFVFRQ